MRGHYRYDYSKKEIAEGAGIAVSTLYGVWKGLEDFKLVISTGAYGNEKDAIASLLRQDASRLADTQLFGINTENPLVKSLAKMDMDLIELTAPKKIIAGL